MATLQAAEDWSGGTPGAQISAANTSFDAMVVGGTPANFTIDSAYSLLGLARSALIQSANFQYGRWQLGVHTRHRHRTSWKVDSLPPAGTNRCFYEVMVGSGATIAAQLRITDAGAIQARNVTSTVDTSTMLFGVGEEFDVEIDLDGAGAITVRLFQGDPDQTATGQFRLHSLAAADETMTGALTATDFNEAHLGAVTTTTGGQTMHCGYASNITDSEVPTPYDPPEDPGGEDDLGNMIISRLTDGVEVEYELLQRVAGSPVLFALDRKGVIEEPEGSISLILEPSAGCWFGAETPNFNATGSSLSGLISWEGFSGRTPDFSHYYSQAWNGLISASQQSQRIRPGKPKTIHYMTTKIRQGMSWADIAAGQANAEIDAMAAGLRTRQDRHFVNIWHEPEDDMTGGEWTAASFSAMYDYVVARCESQGVARAADGGKTVWVVTYMGYRDWGLDGRIEDSLPSPSSYDWLAWDPYFFTRTRFVSTAKWVNDNQSTWPGMYAAMMAIPAVAAHPFMLSEWGVNNNLGQYAGVPSTDGFPESEEAERYDDIAADLEASFPNIKAINHWHGQTTQSGTGANRHYQLYNRTTAQAGFRRLAQDPYFNTAKIADIPQTDN
jgi:hypothetical protein